MAAVQAVRLAGIEPLDALLEPRQDLPIGEGRAPLGRRPLVDGWRRATPSRGWPARAERERKEQRDATHRRRKSSGRVASRTHRSSAAPSSLPLSLHARIASMADIAAKPGV